MINGIKNSGTLNLNGERTMPDCEVAIVGAGPYGLSIAAHLQGCGVDFRIFGVPMQNWRKAMPVGNSRPARQLGIFPRWRFDIQRVVALASKN